jgi:hypothetical protein
MFKIKQCVICGCDDVPNLELDYPIESEIIKSVKIVGAKCTNCEEEYYDLRQLQVISEMEKFLKDLTSK